MQTGRPPKTKRTPFGERLHRAREEKGISLKQVAEELSVPLQTYANWERRDVGVRPHQLSKLSKILEVSLEDLLGPAEKAKKQGGPTGKARKLFEELSTLPRHQQQHILQTVEGMLIAQKARKAS